MAESVSADGRHGGDHSPPSSGKMRSTLVAPLLDAPGRELAEVAAHRPVAGRGAGDVVLGSAELEVAVPRCPRRAHVAVERHARAARVDEVGPVRAGSPELLVTVPEDDRP